MAPEWFKALCCIRQPPSPSDDPVDRQVPAPIGAAQPTASIDPVLVLTEVPVEGSGSPSANIGDVRADTVVENTRARSLGPSPSPRDTNIPVPASIQGSPSNSTGALAPALIEAQPAVPCSPEESTDTPVPAHTEEVAAAASTTISPMISLDPAKAREHIDRIDRFRILVMGRANAGKTTILQRVCNTTDQPEIFNGEGEKVDATLVQGSLKRGEHNIEDELVFKSNRRFVFHDSRGFEAGSEREFDMMKEFVMDRAKTMKLDKRIHTIWFCIPLNESHRMVTAAEKKFFDMCDTGHVPVIVLLTKTDTLALDAVMEVDDGLNEDDAMERAQEVEKRMLKECLIKVKDWLNKSRFPPSDYLSLTGMQEEDADCATLLTYTANALNEEGLQQLLISTQQSNLGLCMEFAITKTLKNCMHGMVGKITPAGLAYYLSRWFPYKHELGRGRRGLELRREEEEEMDYNLVPNITHYSSSVHMPTLAISQQPSLQYVAAYGIGAILVFEYLYFLLQANKVNGDLQANLEQAVRTYQTSGVQATVAKLITEAFQHHGEDVEVLTPILVGIAKENQMSKMT